MSRVDALRARLARATELGVPGREFLRHELQAGRELTRHLNSRLAQAGRETEDAVRKLELELDHPELCTPWRSSDMANDDDADRDRPRDPRRDRGRP